jgi:hypothetical protein
VVLSCNNGFALISADVGIVPSGSRLEVLAGVLGLLFIHLFQLARRFVYSLEVEELP